VAESEKPVAADSTPAPEPVAESPTTDPVAGESAGSTLGAGPVPAAARGAGAPGWAERHWRLAHLPVVLGASLALLVLATAVGAVVAGGTGAVGVAAGVGLVTLSYLASTLVLAWADSVHPNLVLPFGLATYVAKFSVIGVALAGVAGSGWAGLRPFGWGVVVGVIAWIGANIWWVSTVHQARIRGMTGG
jgi:hypothetical protein